MMSMIGGEVALRVAGLAHLTFFEQNNFRIEAETTPKPRGAAVRHRRAYSVSPSPSPGEEETQRALSSRGNGASRCRRLKSEGASHAG